MSVLNCRYYGFECNYELEGNIKKIVDEFRDHTIKEHHVDYPKELIMNTILQKRP